MLDKQRLIERLEEERKCAVECGLSQMALGIAQAITVIESLEEQATSIEIDFDEMKEIEYSLIDDDEEDQQ